MSDYGRVHFTFLPEDPANFKNQKVFLYGEMTGYRMLPEYAMAYNQNLNVFEKTVELKNGFYSYIYVTQSINNPDELPKMHRTEGNNWETENQYSILLYYRPFGGRADELVGYSEVNSLSFLSPNLRR
jgi:hypothetical protein